MYKPQGLREVSRILSLSDQFLIYYDPDIDGAVAGEFVRRLLTKFNKRFSVYINENRAHGLKLTQEQIAKLKGFTIILVDAGMTREELVMLTDAGINIINIDHHHVSEPELITVKSPTTNCEGVIVNNQYENEDPRYRFLSGAGVVYYVIKWLFPDLFGKEEESLVGVSLLSDIRPIDNDEARKFLHTTFTHESHFINYLIGLTKAEKDFGFGLQTFDRNFIDFTFSPKINALFRLNKGYEAIQVFSGSYTNRTDLDVFRNIQNSIRDRVIENLEGEELSNLAFKHVPHDMDVKYDYELTNFVGLACSKVKNLGKTTFLCVKENGKVKRGSVRAVCDDVDYLGIFRKHGFKAEGHKNAFGVIAVDFEKVDLEALNKDIAEAEEGYEERKYLGRILEITNLSFFVNSKNIYLAEYNNYVRDKDRRLLKYSGSNIEMHKRGKAFIYEIDGIKVLSFEEDLTPENGLILPILERGYVNFYLTRY